MQVPHRDDRLVAERRGDPDALPDVGDPLVGLPGRGGQVAADDQRLGQFAGRVGAALDGPAEPVPPLVQLPVGPPEVRQGDGETGGARALGGVGGPVA
jgi:hypothetical protein